MILQLAGHFALMPLMHESRETLPKLLLLLCYSLGVHYYFGMFSGSLKSKYSLFEKIYMQGFVALQLFMSLVIPLYSFLASGMTQFPWIYLFQRSHDQSTLLSAEKIQFIPNAICSVFCSIGILLVSIRSLNLT